jgi:dUTP pyrophosphatase
MEIRAIHQNFIMPSKGSELAGAFDIYMPEPGIASGVPIFFPLGFAAAVPEGHVALLLPRSSAGAKHGVELNNTCGVIDSDYRGEWKAAMRTKDGKPFHWDTGDRVLQFLVLPVAQVELQAVSELPSTERGEGGFGSTGA